MLLRRRAALLVAGCLAWASPAGAASALRPQPAARGSYGETFTFLADLEDGSYVQLSLGLTNLGPGGIKSLCRATVIGPDGKPWRASERQGADAWTWSDAAGERLAVGPCAAWTADPGLVVEARLDGGTVRLAFATAPARRVPPDATVLIGRDAYQNDILLSRARVAATLELPGRPARQVAGAGYADHSRSTVQPRDLASRWVRFRALRGERAQLVLGRQGHDGRFAPVWECGEDAGSCRKLESFRVERGGEGAAPTFRVALAGAGAETELRSGKLLYREAPVEELGLLGKVVAPFVGSPVTYVYRGQLTAAGQPPLDGIMEIEVAEE